MEIVSTIVLFIVVLSVLVLVHELGHYLVARFFGVHVEEFGIGFPPRATGWFFGKTLYSVNWLPLGGFVRLKGEQGEAAGDADSFASRSIVQRLSIVIAGVVMNILLAILLFTFGYMLGMPAPMSGNIDPSHVREQHIVVTRVLADTPAARAKLEVGEKIEKLDEFVPARVEDVQSYLSTRANTPVQLTLSRGDDVRSLSIIPEVFARGGEERVGIGIALEHVGIVVYPPHIALGVAVRETFTSAFMLLKLLGAAIKNLAFQDFVGPVGIAAYTGVVSQLGFAYLINLMAQLSLSLALINILPIPALDGGRAFLTVIESIRRKPLSARFEQAIHTAGFFFLISLILLITVRDIQNLLAL